MNFGEVSGRDLTKAFSDIEHFRAEVTKYHDRFDLPALEFRPRKFATGTTIILV